MPHAIPPRPQIIDKEKWTALVKEWEASDISQLRFCQQKNISMNTFSYWRGKMLANKTPAAKTDKFIPLNIIADQPMVLSEMMTLENKSGIKLHLPLSAPIEYVVGLLKLVGFIDA